MAKDKDEDFFTDHTHNRDLEVKDENGKVIGHMCSHCGAST